MTTTPITHIVRATCARWHQLTCAQCGAPFCWRNRRRKRCLDCADEAAAEQHRDVYHRRNPAAGYYRMKVG